MTRNRKMPAKWNDGHSTKPSHGQCLPSPLPIATMTPTINWSKTPATGSSLPRPPTWTRQRAASAAAKQPSAYLPDSLFLRALGTEDVYTTPPITSALSLRAAEEWERCICENQAFSILHQAQEGRQELIKKDGGEMLVSIVRDRPLAEAKARERP